jgi:hypothetical protein
VPFVNVLMFEGEELVLTNTQHSPTRLFLTPTQFQDFQACLAAKGLPPDLFYPAAAQRRIVEPTAYRTGDGRLLGYYQAEVSYSPLQWLDRRPEMIEAIKVPSEAERRRAMHHACAEFLLHLLMRIQELHEVGAPDPTGEENDEVTLLLHAVNLVSARVTDSERGIATYRRNVREAAEKLGVEPKH